MRAHPSTPLRHPAPPLLPLYSPSRNLLPLAPPHAPYFPLLPLMHLTPPCSPLLPLEKGGRTACIILLTKKNDAKKGNFANCARPSRFPPIKFVNLQTLSKYHPKIVRRKRKGRWLSNTVKRIRVVQMVKLASRTVRTVRFVKIFTDRE